MSLNQFLRVQDQHFSVTLNRRWLVYGSKLLMCTFCIMFLHFCIRILQTHAKNTEEGDIDQHLKWAAPKDWSKYSTIEGPKLNNLQV